jgi:hypothetical protein
MGEYEVKVFDANNNLLETHNVDVNNDEACKNLDFVEFENTDIFLDPTVNVFGAEVAITADGYVKNGMYVSGRSEIYHGVRINLGNFRKIHEFFRVHQVVI